MSLQHSDNAIIPTDRFPQTMTGSHAQALSIRLAAYRVKGISAKKMDFATTLPKN
jgi:hypothetical protein